MVVKLQIDSHGKPVAPNVLLSNAAPVLESRAVRVVLAMEFPPQAAAGRYHVGVRFCLDRCVHLLHCPGYRGDVVITASRVRLPK